MKTLKEAYIWQVKYGDDTWLAEYSADCLQGRGWSEVDKLRVAYVELLSADGTSAQGVQIPAGAEPVFFRRRNIILNVNTEEEQHLTIAHCIGWKQGEQGTYLFVFANGSVLLTSNLQAV